MNSLIIFGAQYLIVFVVLLWAVAWYLTPRDNRLRFFVTTVIAGIVALVLSRIAGKIYFDPRPFVHNHTIPLIKHAADNGFPSDHALFTMTLTAVTFFFSRKIGVGMLVLSILVGAARVLAGVHSPIDIAGAWILGVIGAWAGVYLVRWFWAGREQSDDAESRTQSMR